MRKRSQNELVRLDEQLRTLVAFEAGIRAGMKAGGPIGQDAAQGVVQAAMSVATTIARHDAFLLAESDAKGGGEGET